MHAVHAVRMGYVRLWHLKINARVGDDGISISGHRRQGQATPHQDSFASTMKRFLVSSR